MQTDHSLLREAIRAILREMDGGDLSGKSLSKVSELVEINRRLRDAGLGVEVGLASEGSGMKSFFFAVRSLNPEGASSATRLSSDVDSRMELIKSALPLEDSEAKQAVETARKLIEEIPWGRIEIRQPRPAEGPCSGAFMVNITSPTKNKWGPLLYDLAMEWASQNGGGLMSDRGSVSPSAQAVWDKYSTSRADSDPSKDDVKAVQLDILPGFLEHDKHDPKFFWGKNQLTPENLSDDCDQFPTGEHARGIVDEKGVGDWQFSPLSRAYKKNNNSVTGALSDVGLLW